MPLHPMPREGMKLSPVLYWNSCDFAGNIREIVSNAWCFGRKRDMQRAECRVLPERDVDEIRVLPSFTARSPIFPARGILAFTLIEMLVAIAVLALLLVMLTQIFSIVSDTWLGGQARQDSFSKARVLMDMVAQDLKSGVFRSDLASFPDPANPVFYTKRSGFSSAGGALREVSLVSYTLDTSGKMQRGDLAIPWSNSSSLISFGVTDSLPTAGAMTMRDMTGGVLAFRLLFVNADGTLSPVYDPSREPRGFAIGMVITDEHTLERLGASRVANLSRDLQGAVSGTNSLRMDWENYLNNDIDWTDFPKSPGGIRIFERYVPWP